MRRQLTVAVPAALFPSNWITTNPQFAQANYWTNSGKSNYNSLLRCGDEQDGQGERIEELRHSKINRCTNPFGYIQDKGNQIRQFKG